MNAEQTSIGIQHLLKNTGDGFGFDVKIPNTGRYIVTLFHKGWKSSSKMSVCTASNCKEQFLKQVIGSHQFFSINKVEVEVTTTNNNETVQFNFKRQDRHYDYKGTQWQVLEAVKLEEVQ
ncbi:hypothetical protein HWV00_08935 [Moritella sp. 24]|nr:hypothetical protein HWV00_08935 [Moritella sp. 24]